MKNEDFNKLLESVKQAGQIKRGQTKSSRVFRHAVPNIQAIRAKLNISQNEFALMLGVSSRTLQNWEQGRRKPEGSAKALLTIADKNPKAVLEALHT